MTSKLYKYLRKKRYTYYFELLQRGLVDLLDVGCNDKSFVELTREEGYKSIGTDIEENIETSKRRADIITCFQVLEEVKDPVKSIKNLGKNYKKQLIISVPNEPLFSLCRLGWDKGHKWAITPQILKYYLGKPVFEKLIVYNLFYVGVWKKNKKR